MEVNETTYHDDTPERVIDILEDNRRRRLRKRIKIFYGDRVTGKVWGDVERCYVGRSTGVVKIPLCIYRSNSTGGGSILDSCIVRIETSQGGRLLWEHEKYHVPDDNVWNVHG